MKSDHRHELKTNELAEWLGNLPQWTKENLKTIIFVLVLVAAVAVLYTWRIYSKNVVQVREQIRFTNLLDQLAEGKMRVLQASSQGRDVSYILIQPGGPAENLKIFAQGTNNKQMAALALTKHAEALRTELHYRLGTISKQDLTEQMDRAKAAYTEAIARVTGAGARGKINPSLVAVAEFGLGLCEEELGDFETARQKYQDIVANPDFEGTVAVVQAKRRLETMADYKQKVVFMPAPPPKPTAAPERVDANQPADTNVPIDWSSLVDFNIPIQPVGTEAVDTNAAGK